MVRALFVSVCLFAVVGCGSGTSHTASNPAQADCYFYVENELCPTLITAERRYTSFSECVDSFESLGQHRARLRTVTVEYSGLSRVRG